MAHSSSSVTASALAILQHRTESLRDRVDALPRRFGASFDSLRTEHLTEDVMSAAREAASDCRVLASYLRKACKAAADEARARAAQLEAGATVLEADADGDGLSVVEAAARALVSYSPGIPDHFVAITGDGACLASLLRAVAEYLRVRDGVDNLRCTVNGGGITTYQRGDNHVVLGTMDHEGVVMESIEAGDVCVRLKGAKLMHVVVREAGVVEVAYNVPDGCVAPLTLRMSVCGAVLPASPWTVVCPLGDSVILASVAPARFAVFLHKLTTAWLPGRGYTLLYRGSRDGMNAAAFHRLCDGKGPTLVLVQHKKAFVFGGYADASWETPEDEDLEHDAIQGESGKHLASPDGFLLSVGGPHNPDPVRFPVRYYRARVALWCHASCGPAFTGGFTVRASGGSPTATFDAASRCKLDGETYTDVLGHAYHSLTGSRNCTPDEVEVFAVAHASV